MKSVSISEGGKGRIFPQTDKLKINNVGGGNSLWLPEEEVVTGTLYADENGIYLAENDGFSCYDTVVVRVEDETDPDDPDWELDPDDLDEDVWDEESYEEYQEDPEAFEEKYNDKEKWKAEKAKKEKSQKIKKVKSLKPSKITGIDPVNGNPYQVGVDSEGNLTKEMLPSSIHIVVSPWKREYENGEEINFYGMHVYLLDKDGHPFKSEQYPTGEIPFEELLLPVTTAEGDGSDYSSSTLDGVTVNYCDAYSMSWGFGSTESSFKANSWKIDLIAQSGTFYGLIRTDSERQYIISPTICGDTPFVGTIINQNGDHRSFQNNHYATLPDGKRIYFYLFPNLNDDYPNVHYYPPKSDGETSALFNALYNGTPSGGALEIPVQWIRSDGEMLEDSFQISVSSQSEDTSNSSTSDSGSGHTSGGF